MTSDLIVAPDAGALEADPVAYMAVVLNRAKEWLSEAQSIDSVRDTKAIAVGYESVIREKELAFDAQLSATEIVRRCERRIGELVRAGQKEGAILRRGQTVAKLDPVDALDHPRSVREFFPDGSIEQTHAYAMADAPVEQFEQAITTAREEGNLSRANVVRKVKGEVKPVGRSEFQAGRRRIDGNRVLSALAQDLDAAATGLDLMVADEIDQELIDELVPSIRASIATINRHIRRISNG